MLLLMIIIEKVVYIKLGFALNLSLKTKLEQQKENADQLTQVFKIFQVI